MAAAPESATPQPQSGRRTIDLLLTFGTNIGILGFTIATGTLNARLLGPTGRGELAAIQTMPSVLGMIALLGLPSAVGYFAARLPDQVRRVTLSALSICLMASVPAMVVGYFLMPWALGSQPERVVEDARFYLLYVALQAIVTLPYMALQGLGKFRVWNLLRLLPNIAGLAAILLAWGIGDPTSRSFSRWGLFFYSFIGPVVYVTLWLSSRAGTDARTVTNREMLRYGLPSALMIPAGLLNLQLDQLAMAAWLPSMMLGLYAVSVSWSGMLSPAFGALGSMVFPALAAAADRDAQRALVARSFRVAVLMVLVLGVGLALVTPVLLPLFFGQAFRPAVPAALVLVAAGMVLNLNNLSGEILRGLGAPRWPLYSQLTALPVTVVMLVFLLPRWSIVGAAVSSLIAYATAGWVSIVGIRRTTGLPTRDLLLPTQGEYMVLYGVLRGAISRLKRRPKV